MSVLIKHMAMPKGCIYANDKDQTEYCPLLNHDDVPFCQYIENEPEIAIGIDERPVYCPLSDVPEPCKDAVSRQAAIDAIQKHRENVLGGYQYDESVAFVYAAAHNHIIDVVKRLPSAQPEIKPIDYQDCANAMLRMWMDKVVTDGEYNRIMDKLNAFWGTRNERSD